MNSLKLLFFVACVVLAMAVIYPEKTNITNPTAFPYKGEMFSGFVRVNPKTKSNIFYMVFGYNGGSINQNAPVILWIEGGPGCASTTGAFNNFGPFGVSDVSSKKLKARDMAWTKFGHLVTIDQPIATGFSRARGGEVVKNTDQATEHFQVFIARFYQLFPNFVNNDLYIIGQSYAGKYIPSFAHRILSNMSNSYIKLKGILLGAPWMDGYKQVQPDGDFYYSAGLINRKLRDYMKNIEKTSAASIENENFDYGSALNIFKFDTIQGLTAFDTSNYRNYLDDEVFIDDGFDYDNMIGWLNNANNQKLLGIPSTSYTDCNDNIYATFNEDIAMSILDKMPLLLQKLRVLTYGCQDDADVATPGIVNALRSVDWPGMDEIDKQAKKAWVVDNEVVGLYKTYQNYTYVTVLGAGHLAFADKVKPMYELVNKFINNIPLQ